jgi:TonB family protein
MTDHMGALDAPDRVQKYFLIAGGLHLAVVGGMFASKWFAGHTEMMGDPNAGGSSVGIEVASSIPIPHQGKVNPVANDTQSQVPQETKPVEKVKQEKVSKDAVALKSKTEKPKPVQQASARRLKSFDANEDTQIRNQTGRQANSELYSVAGSGQIGTGEHTTLGTRFGAYAKQIRELTAQKWRTNDVSTPRAPVVIATFDLMRDGTAKNVRLLQSSGISALDNSVKRAIFDASPYPPIPPGFDKDHAQVEFSFELKR